MDLRQVAAFIAVAEELHFGRAADRLHMAQPPLSQLIRRLEHDLGTPLFERTTRQVRLTPAGDAFLAPARRILRSVEEAEQAARRAAGGEVGRVRIGFAGASSHETLPLLTEGVRTRFPGIELLMEGQTYAHVALSRVADGTLDLGFVRLPADMPGVRTRPIAVERLVCALPSSHPLAGHDRIDLHDLATEPFVSFPANAGSTVHDAIVAACGRAGFHPRIEQMAPDTYTILALVAAGVGVTLTLSSCQHVQQHGLVYRELAGDPFLLHPALAWREDNASPALRSVLAVAERVLPTIQ